MTGYFVRNKFTNKRASSMSVSGKPVGLHFFLTRKAATSHARWLNAHFSKGWRPELVDAA